MKPHHASCIADVLGHEQLDACADWGQWGIRSQSYTCQRSEVVGAFEGASETQESEMPLEAPLPEPKTIGALLLGIQGDRWPRRRWALEPQIFTSFLRLLTGPYASLHCSAQVHGVSVAVHGSTHRSGVGLCAANIALDAYRHVTYSLQGAPATVSEAQKPASLLLGDFSAHSSITSCRRDVDQLAALLGPLLTPLVGKAVNLASAAYVARTLAQPALLTSEFADACHEPGCTCPAPGSTDESQAGSEGDTCSDEMMPLQRSATTSWILTEG